MVSLVPPVTADSLIPMNESARSVGPSKFLHASRTLCGNNQCLGSRVHLYIFIEGDATEV